jgi:hypothetical protein
MTHDMPPKILSAILAVMATAVLTLAASGKPTFPPATVSAAQIQAGSNA